MEISKSEFNYYIHRSSVTDYNSFFKKGVIDKDTTFRIESTMERISDEDIANGFLENKMKELRNDDENVFLIKIPKCYFPTHEHRDGTWDVPIPLFYEKKMTDEFGNQKVWPILIPNLIQGCYNRQKGFIRNDNYCPVFDPSGLKFAYEQLQPMRNSQNGYINYEQYMKRNAGSMRELFYFDRDNNIWGAFVDYYSSKFGTEEAVLFDDDRESRKTL